MRARATCETIAPTSAKHLSHCVSQASPCVPRKARGREETTAVNQLPNKSCAELHLARVAEAGADGAVEVEDQVRVLRHQDVGGVEQVEDLDDGLERGRLPELELAGDAQIERRERVGLASRVALHDAAVG